MGGSAKLDRSKLSDALVGVVDTIRRDVHEALGTRTYRVFIVVRRFSGDHRGLGSFKDQVTELDPRPLVRWNPAGRAGPVGQEEIGDATLTEVSLTYTLEELMPAVDDKSEVVYRIEEAHGQRQPPKFFSVIGKPVPRRGDNPGDRSDWRIILKQVQALSQIDSADA